MSIPEGITIIERGKSFSNDIISYFQSTDILETVLRRENAEETIKTHLKEFALRFAKEFGLLATEIIQNELIEEEIKVNLSFFIIKFVKKHTFCLEYHFTIFPQSSAFKGLSNDVRECCNVTS